MIGGIGQNGGLTYQSGNGGLARERTDIARAPSTGVDDRSSEVRQGLRETPNAVTDVRPVRDNAATERRIEARRAAEDVRLEQFRADDVPLSVSRALSTFAEVAARGDAPDSILTGIDIQV